MAETENKPKRAPLIKAIINMHVSGIKEVGTKKKPMNEYTASMDSSKDIEDSKIVFRVPEDENLKMKSRVQVTIKFLGDPQRANDAKIMEEMFGIKEDDEKEDDGMKLESED